MLDNYKKVVYYIKQEKLLSNKILQNRINPLLFYTFQ